MRPAPSQDRIDIIIHNGDEEWWQIVAARSPINVLFAGVLVTVILWLRRRWRTGTTRPGRRSDWWHGARWALDASLDDDPKRHEVGLAASELLNASNLSGKEESRIIAEAFKVPLRGRESMSMSVEKKRIDAVVNQAISASKSA